MRWPTCRSSGREFTAPLVSLRRRGLGEQHCTRRAEEHPAQQPLFSDLSAYILKLRNAQHGSSNGTAVGTTEPASKKRKIEGGETTSAAHNGATKNGAWADAGVSADYVVPDTSFAVPQRKKFALEITADGLRARAEGQGAVEFGIAFADIGKGITHGTHRTLASLDDATRKR